MTLLLSPVALAVVLFYSYTKRFTRWSHLVLGFALGIAPAAAWIAVRGSLDPRILLLTAAVTFWVGGFDVLYACQDIEFDRAKCAQLHPTGNGCPQGPHRRQQLCTSLMLGLLVALVVAFGLGKLAVIGIVVVAALLAYEHSLVASDDLSQLNAAFFQHERRDCCGVFCVCGGGPADKKLSSLKVILRNCFPGKKIFSAAFLVVVTFG